MVIAFSGGADSTALLLALLELTGGRVPVRALHFNHRIEPEADQWQAHCERFCESRDIPIKCGIWDRSPGVAATEDAARAARYRWLTRQLADGEALLTAHHADDQIETLLLGLFQGRGLNRLAGIPRARPLVGSTDQKTPPMVYRPLLEVSRDALEQYLNRLKVRWIHDPANAAGRDQRSFLRNRILPPLRTRFAQLDETLLDLIGNLNARHEFRRERAASQLRTIRASHAQTPLCGVSPLSLAGLLALDLDDRDEVLRDWVHLAGQRAPTDRQLAELNRQIEQRVADSKPEGFAGIALRFQQMEMVATRKHLHLTHQHEAFSAEVAVSGCGARRLTGQLEARFEHTDQRGITTQKLESGALRWRQRIGGERFYGIDSARETSLKSAFQKSNVPSFLRFRLPLLWDNDQLLWVYGLGFTRRLAEVNVEEEASERWLPRFAQVSIEAIR